MGENFANAGVFLIQTFFGLYILVVIMRFLMQTAKVDFYNPISQAIVTFTDPPIKPLRRLIPSIYGVDLSILVLALILQIIALALIIALKGFSLPNPLLLASWSVLGMFALVLDIYFFALIIMVISSWIAPHSNHPILMLIYQLTAPLCTPARRLIPPMGGLDISIIVVFAFITVIDNWLVVEPLRQFLACPKGLILGL
jgi:YggT family protein